MMWPDPLTIVARFFDSFYGVGVVILDVAWSVGDIRVKHVKGDI